MRIGLKDLAARLELDVSTVSRALRSDPRVRRETTERVQRLARDLDYRPSLAARALKGGRTNRVAVLLSAPQQRFASPIFLELLATLDRRLRERGMSLTVFSARDVEDEQRIVRSIVEDRLADGLVLGRTRADDARVRYLLDRGLPFVTFGRTAHADAHPWVEIDYGLAGELAVEALLEARDAPVRIVAAPEGLRFADAYCAGAEDAARRLTGRAPQIERVPLSEAGGYEAARRFAPDDRPAVACIQDLVAFGVYRHAAENGRRVGRDLTVFGGQNFPGSEHAAPPLSTFSTEDERVAEALSSLILARLDGTGAAEAECLTISPRAVLRGSHKMTASEV
ncbi:MAG: LacI family DNA-binding transcriptional regulator [Pseudomonadota bacterium]